MLHSQMVSQRTFSKVLLRATLCCFSPAARRFSAAPSHMSPLSFCHIFCFCICRGNNSHGKGDLPADLLIIHHSQFVFTVCSGWVSSSKTAPWLWGWLRGHLWSSGKWTAVLLLACCQTSGLPACLPPLTRPGVAGILMSAVCEHCHWNTLWNVISHKANLC